MLLCYLAGHVRFDTAISKVDLTQISCVLSHQLMVLLLLFIHVCDNFGDILLELVVMAY